MGCVCQDFGKTLCREEKEENRVNNKIIIIEGYLASGKSTFAELLSEELKIPCLIKDKFKTALCSSISIGDRRESSRFSVVTFDGMMYVAEQLLKTGVPLILEGNFVPAGVKETDESEVIRRLIQKYDSMALTFKFTGDTRILYRRFTEREALPERGQANRIGRAVAYDEFCGWCHNLDPFDIGGKVVPVDTTDFGKVDFTELKDTAGNFLAPADY